MLLQILPRAFRRATEEIEVDPYAMLAQQALDEGLSFEAALRRGLKGLLCAPEFLYMEERLIHGDSEAESSVIDDSALASRLSYFLWEFTSG